jgi:hypothetical protein
MIASFIIHYLDWQAGNKFGPFATDTDYPLTGLLPREMRPVAFLDPSAFIVTYVVKLPTSRLRARFGGFTPMSSAFART